jgi:hypothetical protein
MRHSVPALLLLVLSACGTRPDDGPRENTPTDAPDPVLVSLRDGVAPDTLRYDTRPAWLAEIAQALAEDRPWKSEADSFAVLVHFAAHAGPDHMPIVESLLSDPKPERRMRGLMIVRLSKSPETLALLESKSADLLDTKTPQVAKVAVGAMGYRKARGATESLLSYYEETDDPAAMKALGRIWEGGGDAALRTFVLVVAHTLAMSPASTDESVDTMIRVMTDAELGEFLDKWVPESFGARERVVDLAGKKDFNAERGRKIHEAFLKSPDAGLVTTILWSSPHKLSADRVNPLLDDERVTPNGAHVRDYAVARLESMETGLSPELPADEGLRDRRLKKGKGRR